MTVERRRTGPKPQPRLHCPVVEDDALVVECIRDHLIHRKDHHQIARERGLPHARVRTWIEGEVRINCYIQVMKEARNAVRKTQP